MHWKGQSNKASKKSTSARHLLVNPFFLITWPFLWCSCLDWLYNVFVWQRYLLNIFYKRNGRYHPLLTKTAQICQWLYEAMGLSVCKWFCEVRLIAWSAWERFMYLWFFHCALLAKKASFIGGISLPRDRRSLQKVRHAIYEKGFATENVNTVEITCSLLQHSPTSSYTEVAYTKNAW